MKWEFDRQWDCRGSGYYFGRLFQFSISRYLIDLRIIRYKTKGMVGTHLDPVEKGYKHYRFNYILKRAKKGGDFYISDGEPIFKLWRFVLFRPDIFSHGVTQVLQGERWTLSLGVAIGI